MLAEESGCVAEERRCLGDAHVRVGGGRFDVGLDPLRYDHGSDQRLDGHVSRLNCDDKNCKMTRSGSLIGKDQIFISAKM